MSRRSAPQGAESSDVSVLLKEQGNEQGSGVGGGWWQSPVVVLQSESRRAAQDAPEGQLVGQPVCPRPVRCDVSRGRLDVRGGGPDRQQGRGDLDEEGLRQFRPRSGVQDRRRHQQRRDRLLHRHAELDSQLRRDPDRRRFLRGVGQAARHVARWCDLRPPGADQKHGQEARRVEPHDRHVPRSDDLRHDQ